MDLGRRSLQREVMPPRRPSSSFGLIAVSTLAMVFAVSSSLLLFSAHGHRSRGHCPHAAAHRVTLPPHARPAPPRTFELVPPVPATPPAQEVCRGPVYRSTADGRTEVMYEQCAARPFARPVPVE